MDEKSHQLLLAKIDELRQLLAQTSTESVLGYCGWFMYLDLYETYEAVGLRAPYVQCLYLLGLSTSTPKHPDAKPLTTVTWLEACKHVQIIYGFYARHFEESQHDPSYKLSHEQHLAVTNYFFHQLTTPRITGVDQIVRRIKDTLVPFDEAIRTSTGISASDALAVADAILHTGQADVDRYNEAVRHGPVSVNLETVWKHVPDFLVNRHWHSKLADLRFTARPIPRDRISRLFTCSPASLAVQFGQSVIDGFFQNFVSVRQTLQSKFSYPTEPNPAAQKPVFVIDADRWFHPPGRFIYNAILDNFSDALMTDEMKANGTTNRFLTRRDSVLESQTRVCLERYFGSTAAVHCEVYDEQGHEHDVVVKYHDTVLAVEAKASPPALAFRDPEKAWSRLRQSFLSDKGIQKAFEQARRIVRLARPEHEFILYNKKKTALLTCAKGEVNETFSICVTGENHGPIAADLSILLNREVGDEYPWVVSIFELRTILEGFSHLGLGPEQFLRFLRERRQLHGNVLPCDECEVAGIFIRYGGLTGLFDVEPEAYVVLAPKDGDLFDQIFMEKRGGPTSVVHVDEPYQLHKIVNNDR